MSSKKVLISGYYGFDNFGDELILSNIISQLKNCDENIEITVISKNPQKTNTDYNVKSVGTFDLKNIIKALKKTDVLVSGGGSLLQDITSLKSLLYYLFIIFLAKFFNKKVFIYAQGIGPINNEIGKFLAPKVLRIVDKITVRDLQSQEFLKKWNINSELTTDPAWGMAIELNEKAENLKKIVGIQLRDSFNINEQKLNLIAKALLKNFNKAEFDFLIIPLQPTDIKISNKFSNITKEFDESINIAIKEGFSISEKQQIMTSVDFIVCMRYHALLSAILFKIPALAVCYDPKVENLAKEFEIPNFLPKETSENILNEKFTELKTTNNLLNTRFNQISEQKEIYLDKQVLY